MSTINKIITAVDCKSGAPIIEIVKMFDLKSTTKTFRACINHIANNTEKYA